MVKPGGMVVVIGIFTNPVALDCWPLDSNETDIIFSKKARSQALFPIENVSKIVKALNTSGGCNYSPHSKAICHDRCNDLT